MKDFQNKKVFITGGAQGIGKEIALRFADQGSQILLSDINPDQLKKSCEDVQSRGANCRSYVLDVSEPAAIDDVRQKIEKDVGTIDILVNNAGVVFGGRFLDVPLERHLSIFRVNIEGLVSTTYHFLPLLIANSEANLVNIASASGFIDLPNGSTYASSKWAVIGFSESLRVELKRSGNGHLKVTTVCPGYVATGMFEGVSMPRSTQMLNPVNLSHKIVAAIRKDREFLVEPKSVKLMPILRAMLPIPVWDTLSRLSGTSGSMETWLGRSE